MQPLRHYSLSDRICLSLDGAIRALTGHSQHTGATYPASQLAEPALSAAENKHAAGLMRINHAGEICAQALYHGQGLIAASSTAQTNMQQAAIEEGDHLVWCQKRIEELQSHTSYLNPLWYIGSFGIGMAAGALGDGLSLGFIVETERQVIIHLQEQHARLPTNDVRSASILAQMQIDEAKHRDEALAAGAKELPRIVKRIMALTAKVMVKTSYWI
jgi:ubiquinone biosynthesis monooxygenase Coq7